MATLSTYHHYTRWSDSIERAVLDHNLTNGEAISVKELVKNMFNGCKKVAQAIGSRLIKMSEAVYEARMKESGKITNYYY